MEHVFFQNITLARNSYLYFERALFLWTFRSFESSAFKLLKREYKKLTMLFYFFKSHFMTIIITINPFFLLVSSDVYNIVSERGSVGQFCLFKSAYRIGEEIVGSFDFSNSLIICLKVKYCLDKEHGCNLV